MRFTMIGHCTVLIEAAGKRILTDPFFSSSGNLAYGRVCPPARPRKELQGVDGVLVSHAHWDHVDGSYLRGIGPTPVITPAATRWLIRLYGGRNVSGIKPWEGTHLGDLTVTAVPAIHLISTVGFVLSAEGRNLYFAGDTYYGSFMEEIGRRFRLDAALLPVTTYRLPMTMGETQAVRAVQALKPAVVVPMHLGLVPHSPLLRTRQSPEGFARRLREAGNTARVVVLREGESHTVE
jgi:L-ascorbate metabolism protein UlaG (beta-lactamase superfamily)